MLKETRDFRKIYFIQVNFANEFMQFDYFTVMPYNKDLQEI